MLLSHLRSPLPLYRRAIHSMSLHMLTLYHAHLPVLTSPVHLRLALPFVPLSDRSRQGHRLTSYSKLILVACPPEKSPGQFRFMQAPLCCKQQRFCQTLVHSTLIFLMAAKLRYQSKKILVFHPSSNCLKATLFSHHRRVMNTNLTVIWTTKRATIWPRCNPRNNWPLAVKHVMTRSLTPQRSAPDAQLHEGLSFCACVSSDPMITQRHD